MDKEIKILFADDDMLVCTVVEQAIFEAGWKPVIVHSGRDAYEQYLRNRPAVVVLDIAMPGMSGFEVAQLIRQDDHLTPIIFYSGLTDEDYLLKSIELGEKFYITKNYSERLLISKIKSLIYEPNGKFIITDKVVYDVFNSDLNVGNSTYHLTGIQAQLMRVLCENRNRVVSNTHLYDMCWSKSLYCLTYKKQLNKHINKLRKLLEDDNRVIISCIHGIGYSLKVNDIGNL